MSLTNKRMTVWMIAVTMLFSVLGLGLTTESASAATKAPKKISLKTTASTVDIKGKVTVSVKSVSPSNASKSVKWKSSNKKIATISSKGVVTGKKAGKVKITATSTKKKSVKKSIYLYVKNIKPSSVSLSKSANVDIGKTLSLKATAKPTGVYNSGFTWKSSNTKIATVSSKGTVTPKKAGKVTITVYTKENKKKATCSVTVKKVEIKPENGVYAINKKKYKAYELQATRDGKTDSVKLSNNDIENLFGDGNLGLDWRFANDVEKELPEATFSYKSDSEDYIFEKGKLQNGKSEITVRFAGDIMRTSWWYVDGQSFSKSGGDYTITLYSNLDNIAGSPKVTIEKTGRVFSVEKASRRIALIEHEDENGIVEDKMTIQAGIKGKELEGTIDKGTAGKYLLTIPNAEKYKVKVYACE